MFDNYCLPAKIGGGLAFIMMIVDIFITRFDTFTFICDFFEIFIIMFVIDYFCVTDRITTAWIISICLLIISLIFLYLYYIKDPILMDVIEQAHKTHDSFVS
jgi:hypothetical protein